MPAENQHAAAYLPRELYLVFGGHELGDLPGARTEQGLTEAVQFHTVLLGAAVFVAQLFL